MVGDDTTQREGNKEGQSRIPTGSSVDRRDFLLTIGIAGVGSTAGCIGTDEGPNPDSEEEENTGDDHLESEQEEDTPEEEPDEPDDPEEGGEGEDEEEHEDPEESEDEDETERADMRVYAMDRETGDYLIGAEVTLESSETGETYTLTTREGQEFDGNYARFQNLPLGLYYVTVTADGYEEATNTIQLVESGRQPILHMVPTSTRTADMRVYTEDTETNEYLIGVEVMLENRETGETSTLTTKRGQDFDGNYARFRNLPLGTYEITAHLPGYQPARTTIELGESGRQPIVEMVPTPAGTGNDTITVRLIDAETGEPIPDGTVLMWPNRLGYGPGPAATDTNGEVTFDDLDHYPFEEEPDLEMSGLRAEAAGYESTQRDVSWRPSDGPLELTVEMEPEHGPVDRSVLTVNAVAADTGDPVRIASIYVERNGRSVATERTDRYGIAQFSLQDGVTYTVHALGEGGRYESGTRTVLLDDDTEIVLQMEWS